MLINFGKIKKPTKCFLLKQFLNIKMKIIDTE